MNTENPTGTKHMLQDETFMSVADLKDYVTQRELAKASTSVSAVNRADEARKEPREKPELPKRQKPQGYVEPDYRYKYVPDLAWQKG